MRRFAFPLVLLCLAATGGCFSNLRTPDFFHPGPVGPQRTDAIYTDPYPLDDVGPEVVGGRPRGYQRPVPEVVRSRLVTAPPRVSPQFTPQPLPQQLPQQPFAAPPFTPQPGF